jgi:hypothetical protein
MAGKSPTTHAFAYRVYVEMGPDRTIRGLMRKLATLGHHPSRATVNRWRDKHGWEKSLEQAAAFETQAKALRLTADVATEQLKSVPAEEKFTACQTFEGAFNTLNAQLAGMSTVVAAAMEKYVKANCTLEELLQIARATTDLGRTAADMHRALNPSPPKGGAPKRDPDTGILEGAVAYSPAASVLDELMERYGKRLAP